MPRPVPGYWMHLDVDQSEGRVRYEASGQHVRTKGEVAVFFFARL